MSQIHFSRVTALGILLLFSSVNLSSQDFPLVPQPLSVSQIDGEKFRLPETIKFAVPELETWKRHIVSCNELCDRLTNGKHKIELATNGNANVQVQQTKTTDVEEYTINVTQRGVKIDTATLKGLCRATATLFQLIAAANDSHISILRIKDKPSVAYRNFMVDMGRNPHSVELLKETIDLLWFYKVDSLQLHLTDDQRFAFPSTAFPKLWDGLITLDQFKELEKHAVLRGVTIIPEFEVPGHSGKLRSIYPEVFGKTGTELASSEKALQGIKTILQEMMDVFSSTPYIHIGGDEAFGVPEDLQRDLINKLHAWLNARDKQTIVWEGPGPGVGENKVNEEVIHINWRMINYPADKMLADGYRVVNAAWDPLYIVDHFPRTNFTMTSPEHIYQTLSLTQFKHVNPDIATYATPQSLKRSARLIGFCMPWWEGREENYFPQIVPRLIPFAEVAWHHSIKRDFANFAKRAKQTESSRRKMFYPVTITGSNLAVADDGVFHRKSRIALSTEMSNTSQPIAIRYTLDGTTPTSKSQAYSEAIEIFGDTTVRASAFSDGKTIGHGSRKNFHKVTPIDNLALGKPVTSSATSGPPFSVERVTDGDTGNLDFYLGYPAEPKPIEITIDLESVQEIRSVTVFAYSINNSWEKYAVETSVDGNSFTEVAARLEKPKSAASKVEHEFTPRKARFVRIRSSGNKGYVFDSFSKIVEVQVR